MSECEYACVHVNYVCMGVYVSAHVSVDTCVHIFKCIESVECVNELHAYGSVPEHGYASVSSVRAGEYVSVHAYVRMCNACECTETGVQ